MKAANEDEVLEHMGMQFSRGSEKLSGLLRSWTKAKTYALEVMDRHCEVFHGKPIDSVLDIGIGDMDHLIAWDRFNAVCYEGVDGCEQVLRTARKNHPHLLFHQAKFSELVSMTPPPYLEAVPDAILLLDVLYHIPDEALADDLVQWAADSPAEYIILSHATDMSQRFDGASGAGQGGFAWFPRLFTIPRGWDVIHREDSTEGVQSQCLVVLARDMVT